MTTAAGTEPNKGARRRFRLFAILVLGFMGWATYILIGQSAKVEATEQQLATLRAKQEKSMEMNQELKLQMLRMNDSEYIGQIARRDLGMILPGETSIHVAKPNE